MKGFFITGTDTDVGKTVVSAALTLAWKSCYWKPIGSGPSDREVVQQLTDLSDTHFHPTRYALKASLSPDQAAALEGVTIDIQSCQRPSQYQSLIVEGAGGVYVPLSPEHWQLDLMRQLALPVIVVCRGSVGTINHTMLTLEALRRHHLSVHGVVFNGDLIPENQQTIEKWGKVKTLFHMPYFKDFHKQTFQDWVNQHQVSIQEALT